MSSLTGRIFGNYQIHESVGRGGMATVYRARDRRTSQDVAIKFISPALAENEQFIRRFRREVKVVAQLDHPNIVPVLDYGEQDGYAYQVMPFLNIGSLSDRLDKGPISIEDGGRVLDQVATALAYAHQHGVIHRDVKPSNILLDPEGNALLADFGMARRVEATESLTGSAVIGTPAYMAPEQVQGGPVDSRCDQYALGVILFQLSTGTLPYAAKTPMGYLLKHVNEPFPAASQRNQQVPLMIEHVILKATAKDPAERFESISEMNRTFQASLAFIKDPISNEAPTIVLPGMGYETKVAGQSRHSRKTYRPPRASLQPCRRWLKRTNDRADIAGGND
jgi:serine/threonine protein kinase